MELVKPKYLIGCAGLGGESELWDDTKADITHVEKDPKIAKVLQERKPNREIIVGDAYQYLLDHFNEFNFCWFSPVCQGNTRMIRSGKNRKPRYPDLKLYELKLFFDYNFKGDYVIENVIPYYPPPIQPSIKIGRHLFWSNFTITPFDHPKQPKNFIMKGNTRGAHELKNWLGIQYEGNLYYNGNHDPCQVLRNCVHPLTGKHVHDCYLKSKHPQ